MDSPRRHSRAALYPLGVVLILLSGVCLSTLGVALRHIEAASGWQILFYRAISFTVAILVFVVVRYRGRLLATYRQIGWLGVQVGLFLGLSSVFIVFAILHTTVANAIFIGSTTPLTTAACGWLFLRERVPASTWLAAAAALCGVGLMFTDGFMTGRVLGVAFACMTVVAATAMLLTIRRASPMDMVPALPVAGVVTALVALPLMPGFEISAHDLSIVLLLGIVQYALGFSLMTTGARYVPGAEVALLLMTETVLAPVWAWLGAGEVPSRLTMIGAVLVLGALAARAASGIREARSPA